MIFFLKEAEEKQHLNIYIHIYLYVKIKPNIFKLSSVQKRGEASSHLLWCIRDRVSVKNNEIKSYILDQSDSAAQF